jgi:hypothetical protein
MMRCRLVFHPTSDANRLIYIRPMLCRCLLNEQYSVMSPTKILNLDLSSLSKYLVKPGFGFFSHTFSTDDKQSPSSMRRSVVTWSEDPKTYHKKLYSEPNPMQGVIKEDRKQVGGWAGPRGQRLDALWAVLKTGSHGKIFFNMPQPGIGCSLT